MLKLIRTVIMLCLILGVVFFGVKIFYNSPEAQSSLDQKKLYLEKKVSELKTEAGEKARVIEKLYEDARVSLDKESKNGNEQIGSKNLKTDPAPVSELTKKKNHKETVSLNPVDEEDLILTSEILDPKRTDGKEIQVSKQEHPERFSVESIMNDELEEPVDLNRVAKIRDLYSKAAETLTW